MTLEAFELPFYIQLTLASGFAGYALAFAGKRDRHSAMEAALITMIFGLPCVSVFTTLHEIKTPVALAASLAFLASISVAILWRKYLSPWIAALLRQSNISWQDNAPNAWRSIVDGEKHAGTQMEVTLKDGRRLICQDMFRYEHQPYGPCLLGPDGSVWMYADLTILDDEDKSVIPHTNVVDPDWGAQMTYAPAQEIALVKIRFS